MKLYELTYLLPQTLTGEDRQTIQDKIKTLIEEMGGILDFQSPLILKGTAYPIKKQTTAFIGNVRFYLSPEKTPELSMKLEKDQNIIRLMLIAKEQARTTKKIGARRMGIKTPAPKLGKAIKPRAQPEKTPKVEIEKLEEKLEELLGT